MIGCDAGSPRDENLREAAERLSREGVEVHLDASGDAFAARAGTLIKSPGIPSTEPAVLDARARGAPVLGELELAWRLLPNEFLAVTGTNGKTTATEWIGHIHRRAAEPAAVAGNVGTAASTLVGTLDADATVVCEASSFQLEDTEAFSPEAAVLLNLTPDHLDRHGTFEAYATAKLRIFSHQEESDLAVIPDTLTRLLGELGVEPPAPRARQVTFGTSADAALREADGRLWWRGEPLIRSDELSLPGAHNRQNAMAAAAVSLARGIDARAVAAGLQDFPGVAHRLELVATQAGVAYVNDSKATNVSSTLVALEAYDGASTSSPAGAPSSRTSNRWPPWWRRAAGPCT